MRRLLIVSDDESTRAEFLQHFLRNGCIVSTATTVETALTLADHSAGYDLLLLDLAGRSNSIQLLCQIRSALADAMILVMVDRMNPAEGLTCIEADADDFVLKPLPIQELEVRMAALFHRNAPSAPTSFHERSVRDLSIDLSTRSCYRNGRCVALTSKEFDLLDHLFKNRGCTVSREGLAESVWGTSCSISLRTIDRHIASIRRKIEDDPSTPIYLQTIYGEGYRFMPVE